MDLFDGFKEIEIAGNGLGRIALLFGIVFLVLILGKIAKVILQKAVTKLEDQGRLISSSAFNATARSVGLLSAVIGISIGLNAIQLSESVNQVLNTIVSILYVIAIGHLVYWLADVPSLWLSHVAEKSESKMDDMLVPIVRKSLRVTIVILVLVQVLQILSDKPITSIIAGLGIGGLAVALAAQDSIKNIFGSVVLFVDKPFELGDRIVVDGHDGPVEEVGLRSTKIRTLDGHLVTVPNGELVNKTIQNIGKRPHIRRVVNLTVTYDTPPEKLDRAIQIVKELLDNHEGMHPDYPPRVYFSDFNADSLNMIVYYWYHPPSYWDYMAFSEQFNKEVFRRFNEEGIDFAFPTQTMFLAGDPSRPLTIGVRKDHDA